MFESDLQPAERQTIFNSLAKFSAPNYLEIGVNYGGTFKAVLDYLKGEGYAYGVDLFEDLVRGEGQTHQNIPANQGDLIAALISAGHENFTLLKGNSDTEVRKIERLFDVIFIDGNHTYIQTKKDFEASLTKCESGSIILFHNATREEYPADGGPWKVCTELLDDNRVESIHTPKSGIENRIWGFRVK